MADPSVIDTIVNQDHYLDGKRVGKLLSDKYNSSNHHIDD